MTWLTPRLAGGLALATAAAVCALSVPAWAQEAPAPREPAPVPRITLDPGTVAVNAVLNINVSRALVFEPTSLAPDLWYGLHDRLTLGVVHSNYGTLGFLGGLGLGGFCLTGTDHGCEKGAYDNVGLEGQLDLSVSGLQIGAQLGLYAASFDPLWLAGKVGALVRWRRGPFVAELGPNVLVALNDRDAQPDRLQLPLTLSLRREPGWLFFLQSGIAGPLDAFGGEGVVPFSLGGSFFVNERLWVGTSFTFDNMVGVDGTLDHRTVTVATGWIH